MTRPLACVSGISNPILSLGTGLTSSMTSSWQRSRMVFRKSAASPGASVYRCPRRAPWSGTRHKHPDKDILPHHQLGRGSVLLSGKWVVRQSLDEQLTPTSTTPTDALPPAYSSSSAEPAKGDEATVRVSDYTVDHTGDVSVFEKRISIAASQTPGVLVDVFSRLARRTPAITDQQRSSAIADINTLIITLTTTPAFQRLSSDNHTPRENLNIRSKRSKRGMPKDFGHPPCS
ncbi:hypothetical protein QBC39DRAFT_144246 [Podospora conica]|nr:hypothetical protein QBC39DRAFT_144246 [Schizothecium conicum]